MAKLEKKLSKKELFLVEWAKWKIGQLNQIKKNHRESIRYHRNEIRQRNKEIVELKKSLNDVKKLKSLRDG